MSESQFDTATISLYEDGDEIKVRTRKLPALDSEAKTQHEEDGCELHLSVASVNTDTVKALLTARADVNKRSDYGLMPIHYAAYYNAGKVIVDSLLAAKADLSAVDNEGSTILHYCSAGNYSESERIALATEFMTRGAYKNLNVKNVHGETPLDAATNNGFGALAAFFSVHTSSPSTQAKAMYNLKQLEMQKTPKGEIVLSLAMGLAADDHSPSAGNSRHNTGKYSHTGNTGKLQTPQVTVVSPVAAGGGASVKLPSPHTTVQLSSAQLPASPPSAHPSSQLPSPTQSTPPSQAQPSSPPSTSKADSAVFKPVKKDPTQCETDDPDLELEAVKLELANLEKREKHIEQEATQLEVEQLKQQVEYLLTALSSAKQLIKQMQLDAELEPTRKQLVVAQKQVELYQGRGLQSLSSQELVELHVQMDATQARIRAEQKRREDLKEMCVICHDAKKTQCFVPCGHVCSCERCAVRLEDCPLCRVKIQTRVRFFT